MTTEEMLVTIAENEQKVFDAGIEEANNLFWDNMKKIRYKSSDNTFNYSYAFCFWNKDMFKPTYQIKPTNATYMFHSFQSEINLADYDIDFSQCTNFQNFLLWAQITGIGKVDTRSAKSVSFYVAYMLKQIDELNLKEDGSQTFDMRDMSKLKRINIITGTIGQNIAFDKSTVIEKDTIVRIIEHLSNTSANKTFTIPKLAINNAFGINIDDVSTHTEEWTALRNSKSNWNFSFV